MNQKIKGIILCYISGIATGFCLLFTAIGPAVFILAAPALAVIRRKRENKILLLCFAFAIGLCMTGYFPAFSIRPNLPHNIVFWIDLLVYVVICVVHSAVLTIALWLGHKLSAPRGLRVIYIALFWTAAEWVLGAGPLAWPTLRLSLALWQYPKLFSTASLGGQLFVTVIIIAVNALLAQALCNPKNRKALSPLALAVLVFACNMTFGLVYPSAPEGDTNIAVIQPGGTVIGEERGMVSDESLKLANQISESKPDFIFLPESVLPSYFSEYSFMREDWGNAAEQSGADLFVGGREGLCSTLYHFGANGKLESTYQKIREVPIFENGEGEKSFQFLPKEHSNVIITDSGRIGIMICYESLFSSLAQKAVDDKAELLLVQTNDSWFDSASAKDLHVAHSTYRAVETGRTLVQASLNGNTAVIDCSGRITHSIPQNEQAVLNVKVSLQPINTLYNTIGDWWLVAGLFLVITASVISKYKENKE